MLIAYLTLIANAIRSKLGSTAKINAQNFADKIGEVYDKGFKEGNDFGAELGYLSGLREGREKGIEQGKQAEYDAFWDAFQQNGNRTDYPASFGGSWSIETFKPKYNIAPVGTSYMMFRQHNQENEPYDLVEHLANLGVALDFSKCTFISYTFSLANFSRIGIVDSSKNTNLISVFDGCEAETIDKVILKADGTNTLSGTFNNCKNLKNIVFEGVIGKNGLNLQWSTELTKASIKSVINCLSATTSDLSVTLSLNAVKKAFETSSGVADGNTSAEWLNLIATKSNWTINLV